MYMTLNIQTNVEVRSLLDLPNLKLLMENLKMKINKSELARKMNVDRRTIQKYLDRFKKSEGRNRESKLDAYYDIISDLLSEENKQVFYYKRVLWQYLTDNHGLRCGSSTFRVYIARKPEFERYFTEGRRFPSRQSVVRYETAPGQQAQLDWKESIPFETRNQRGACPLSQRGLQHTITTLTKQAWSLQSPGNRYQLIS